LKCLEKSLKILCGPLVATWQRDVTMKMIMTTALDPDCIVNAMRFVSSLIRRIRNIDITVSDVGNDLRSEDKVKDLRPEDKELSSEDKDLWSEDKNKNL